MGNIFSLSQRKSVQLFRSCMYIITTANFAAKIQIFYRIFVSTRLLPELRVNFQQRNCYDRNDAANHQPDKEMIVSQQFLQPSSEHAGYHHAQRHETCTNGIMRCFVAPIGKVYQIEHVSGEAKAVTELLNNYADIDDQQIVGLRKTQVQKCETG